MTKQPPPRHITLDYLAAKYPMIDVDQIRGMCLDDNAKVCRAKPKDRTMTERKQPKQSKPCVIRAYVKNPDTGHYELARVWKFK